MLESMLEVVGSCWKCFLISNNFQQNKDKKNRNYLIIIIVGLLEVEK